MTRTLPARDFPVAPLQRKSLLFALAIMVVLPIAATCAALLLPQQRPLTGSAHGVLLLALVPLLVLVPVLALLRRRRITLRGNVLDVAATFYTRKTPVAALALEQARILDLDEHTDYRPRLKSNGYDLPGFQAGHFRLRNKARAFCLLTERKRVLMLPQHDGHVLLLSPERPQALLDALRNSAA